MQHHAKEVSIGLFAETLSLDRFTYELYAISKDDSDSYVSAK
jgi:hypothetical protein